MAQRINVASVFGEGRGLAVWEIAFVIFCTLLAEWAVLPVFGRNLLIGAVPVFAAFALMFVSHIMRRETPRDIGLRIDNLPRALYVLALPMAFGSIVLLVVGRLAGTEGGLRGIAVASAVLPFVWLFLWGLMQQYALQGFINRRAQAIFGPGSRSVLLVAMLFGLLHLPNLCLALVTFIAGIVWAAIYQRVPNLFALALSHAVMTIVLVCTIPPAALHGMRVGFGYYLLP